VAVPIEELLPEYVEDVIDWCLGSGIMIDWCLGSGIIAVEEGRRCSVRISAGEGHAGGGC
jgi:hypothetical protein